MPANFPAVVEEIWSIEEKTRSFPQIHKSDIIISFLKTHSLQNDWIKESTHLSKLVSSGELFTGDTESLFASARGNAAFVGELETYLKEKFA